MAHDETRGPTSERLRQQSRGPKKRLLFVDDERRVVEGLSNLLRRHRRVWDMHFVLSGAEALEALDQDEFDVLVTDMRMPRMDGAELLQKVKEKHPKVVRIILSGHTELEAAMRAVPVAHQFLTKPCDADVLENSVNRACSLNALMADEDLRAVVGKLGNLPSLPRVYQALTEALQDEEIATTEVSAILQQDVAMCAKLLQLVNSAFFRKGRRITSIQQAVTYLGYVMIKNLTLTVEVFQAGKGLRAGGFSIEQLQRHAVATANVASGMFPDDMRLAEDAFMAAMLHDIGTLVMAMEMPERLAEARKRAQHEDVAVHSVESRDIGVTHADVGAYLVGLWGLPYQIVEAVAHHHCPWCVSQRSFDVLGAVYVANELVNAVGKPDELERLEPCRDYAESLGVGKLVGQWRDVAEVNVLGSKSGR